MVSRGLLPDAAPEAPQAADRHRITRRRIAQEQRPAFLRSRLRPLGL